MIGLARLFMMFAVFCALCGMIWGIQMSATHDHSLSPAHGHLNLLGWVSCSIFAFYYHLHPETANSRLAWLHFGTVVASVVCLAPGIALAVSGKTEVPAQIGSVLMLVGTGIFGWTVWRAGQGPAVT